mgnify:CR=1 FL=1
MAYLDKNDKKSISDAVKDTIDSLGLNKTVYLLSETTADCQTCVNDPVNKESTLLYCTECGGAGVVTTTNKINIKAIVDREFTDEQHSGGAEDKGKGDIKVHKNTVFKYPSLLKPMSKVEVFSSTYRIVGSEPSATVDGVYYIYHLERVTP